MARRNQVLYRDTDDTVLGGVCSGLGHYFDIDTTLIRVVFVVLAVFGGGGLLAYVILWAVLKPVPLGYWSNELVDRTDEQVPIEPQIEVVDPGRLGSSDLS